MVAPPGAVALARVVETPAPAWRAASIIASADDSYAVPRKLLHALHRNALGRPPTSFAGAWATEAQSLGSNRAQRGQQKSAVSKPVTALKPSAATPRFRCRPALILWARQPAPHEHAKTYPRGSGPHT